MEPTGSTIGTTIHLLRITIHGSNEQQFKALQFRPLKPYVAWNTGYFCLSKVLSSQPFDAVDMTNIASPNRYMLIPFDKWTYLEEAFDIAVLCQEQGAVGVIVSKENPHSIVPPSILSYYDTLLATFAKEQSRNSFSMLTQLRIPVFLLSTAATEFLVSRTNVLLKIQSHSLKKTFRGGEDTISENLIQLFGTGPLDNSKVMLFSQFLEGCSSSTFSTENKRLCFEKFQELSNKDTFPIGIEMMEMVSNVFNDPVDDALSLGLLLKYVGNAKWTSQSSEILLSKKWCHYRIKSILVTGAFPILSISLLSFFSEAQVIQIGTNYFHEEWKRIIGNLFKANFNKSQITEKVQIICQALETIHLAGHLLPIDYWCCDMILKKVDTRVSSSFLQLFRYFKNPPSNEQDSIILDRTISKFSDQCKSLKFLLETIREIRQLSNGEVREYIFGLFYSKLFQILANFIAYDILSWLKSHEYEKRRVTDPSDFKNLLARLDPTFPYDDYLALMLHLETSHSIAINDILIDKLQFISQREGHFNLMKLLMEQNSPSVIINHLHEVEIFLRTIGPIHSQFHSCILNYLRHSISCSIDDYHKTVVKSFVGPVFKTSSIYDTPKPPYFQDSTSSEIFNYFIDECLSFWFGRISDAAVFNNHQSLFEFLRSIDGISKSQPISLNVIAFTHQQISRKGIQNNSGKLWSDLKRSFQSLFFDLETVKVKLLQDLHTFLVALKDTEIAFGFDSTSSSATSPSKTLASMKFEVNKWQREIRTENTFISKLQSRFSATVQSIFPDIVLVAEYLLEESTKTVTEIRLYHESVMSFSRLFSESPKKCFLHFEKNTTKSLLFEKHISSLTPGSLALGDHLTNVEQRMRKIVFNELSMLEVLEISEVLSKSDRKPEIEMKLLSNYFFSDAEVQERMSKVIKTQSNNIELFSLREQLLELVIGTNSKPSTFQRLKFHFENTDAEYDALKKIIMSIDDKDVLMTFSSEKCSETLNSIFTCFGVGTTVDQLRGMLKLLLHLAQADKVWEFFARRPEFVSGIGQGYTELFNEKIEVFLAELSNEEYKLVDSFRTAAFWVCLIFPTTTVTSFSNFCRTVLTSERFLMEISRCDALFNFGELQSSQSNMDFITQLFQNGYTGLNSVLEQLKIVKLNSAFEFNLLLGQLEIRYFDARRNSDVVMSPEQVKDFEQRLEFIQHEEKATDHNIPIYLKQLLMYRRGLAILSGLFDSGHPQFKKSVFTLDDDQVRLHTKSLDLVAEWVDDLQSSLHTWEAKIEEAGKRDPILCLYTIKQLRRIASLVIDGSVEALFNYIAHLFVDNITKRRVVFDAVQEVVDNLSSSNDEVAEDNWLQVFQHFFAKLTQLTNCRGAPLVVIPVLEGSLSESNTRYTTTLDTAVIKKLLCVIFGCRRPGSFQLLWCNKNLGNSEVSSFIQRAKFYPNLRFAVIRFDLLNQSVQNLFLKTILQNISIRNVHFIECGPSILKSASWLPVCKADDVCRDVNLLERYSDWYKDAGEDFNKTRQVCYVGKSGSGKSHQIRKLMKQFRRSPVVVPITEEFDQNDIFSRISSGLKARTDDEFLLVFQVNISTLRENAVERWLALMHSIDNLIFQLLILRSIVVLDADCVINLPWGSNWKIALELPDRDDHLEGIVSESLLEDEVPSISSTFTFIDASSLPLDIDDESRLVCKYLQAFESGLIDTLFVSDDKDTDVVFVLDNSGSMSINDRLNICKDRLKNIIDTKLTSKFRAGLIIFNHEIKESILGPFDSTHKSSLTTMINNATAYGGTNMWTALNRALRGFGPSSDSNRRKVVVALTDGEAGDPQFADSVQSSLKTTYQDVQIIFMTVNLSASNREDIRRRCIRDDKRDILIDAQDGASLNAAWTTVGELLTVSERIMRQAANITDQECLRLLKKYMKLDSHHRIWCKFEQTFWVRYMHRRCQILAASERFNTNQKPTFGSTTMTIMLNEVDRVLSKDHRVDWHSIRHEQMVFRKQIVVQADGKQREDYSWSILCSNPNDQEPDWVQRKALLKNLGMQVPTVDDMGKSDRRVLDSYLAYGIGIELEDKCIEYSSSGSPFDFELGSLPLLNSCEFVLTLDFAIKLLTINERIECGIPCIIQGETGVSKTALTRMLFMLKNGSIRYTQLFLLLKENALQTLSKPENTRKLSALHVIVRHWMIDEEENIQAAWQDCNQLADAIRVSRKEILLKDIFDELRANPMLDPLESCDNHVKRLKEENSASLLLWFVDTTIKHAAIDADVHWTFNAVNVHAAMTVKEIEDIVVNVSERARRLFQLGGYLDSPSHKNTKLCIFFDEINTSSHMGILKEVITNHTVNGLGISKNVVIVAACNPARKKVNFFSNRKQEHGIEWVAGHFQTHPLPPSFEMMLWDYGSLHPKQEEDFIKKRLELFAQAQNKQWDTLQKCEFAKLLNSAHQITRILAELHVKSLVKESEMKMSDNEIFARATSALSLRDILRCFKVYQRLSSAPLIVRKTFIGSPGSLTEDKCLWLLAIGIVYYLRLGMDAFNPEKDYRRKFKTKFQTDCGQDADVKEVSTRAMDELMEQTDLQPGIAPTEGLKENIFMVLVCLISKVPVMIVGPPGSSKTLAIGILVENARGEYSRSEVYKAISYLIPFHYQCSRRSTSQQIEEVFKRAIERQAKALREAGKVSCFVFMDEAGLPEEGRESLKVLHYYLENYMRVEAEVGFVAISNHVLDAAKTNRCNLLMRSSPDHDELLRITTVCSKLQLDLNRRTCYVSGIGTADADAKYNIFVYLCEAFEACMAGFDHPKSQATKIYDFIEFFGLRDYMNFIMLLGRLAREQNYINRKLIKDSIERNFSGSSKLMTKDIIAYFMSSFANNEVSKIFKLENPITLLMRSLSEQYRSEEPTGRYIMCIDTTTSDGILRFLLEHSISKIREKSKLLKLGDFVEDAHVQQMTLISQTRFAMERGDLVVLSHSDSTNESFYDLFNQHFRKFLDRNEGREEVIYHTNIAVGADSRRCRVVPQFQCLMHLTLAELNVAPAPFLNRFEKYRITMTDALEYILSNHRAKFPLSTVVYKVLIHLRALFETVGYDSFIGYAHKQTVESCFIAILGHLDSEVALQNYILAAIRGSNCLHYVVDGISLSMQEREDINNAVSKRSLSRDYFNSPQNERIKDIGVNLLAQAVLNDAVASFVEISLPECLLTKAAFLPSSLIDLVVVEEKFRFGRRMSDRKQIIYTRSTADLVRYQAIHQGQINVIALSEHKKESQFTAAVSNFMNSSPSTDHLTIIIDLGATPASLINFVRSKLDSINLVTVDKSFTLLIHGANVDIKSHCIYDVVFESKWKQKFIDSFCESCDISWLKIAYTEDIFGIAGISQELCKQSKNYFPGALEIIAERVIYFGDTGRQNLSSNNLLQALQSISLEQKLLQSYSLFWRNNPSGVKSSDDVCSTPESYILLRYEIQSIVQKYAANSFNISLLQFVDDEMRSIFTKFLSYYIAAILEDTTFMDLQENSLNVSVAQALLRGIDSLPPPDLGTLTAPMKYFQIQSPTEKSFPFFRRLHNFLEVHVGRIVRLHELDDDKVVWENMRTDFMENCVSSQQTSFEIMYYLAIHDMGIDSEMWEIFLHKFVSIKFPSASDLQSRFLSFWLTRQVQSVVGNNLTSEITCCVILLYMTCKINEDLLQHFVVCLSQFSALPTTKENIDNFLEDFGDVPVTTLGMVTIKFVNLCYNTLMVCDTCESYLSWARSVSSLLLKPTLDVLTNHRRKLKVMTAMMTVSLLVAKKPNWDSERLSHFREVLTIDESELEFSRILTHFKSAISPESDFDFLSLVIRTLGEQVSKKDKICILDEIVVDSVLASSVQWAPLLDILLFGIIDENTLEQQFPSSMVQWVDAVADMKLLDLKAPVQADYIPEFVRGSNYQSRFPFLADVFFHVVWKWIHTFCPSDSSISDINRLKMELLDNDRSDALGIKKIVLSAYDLLIIIRWTDLIMKSGSTADEDIVADDVDLLLIIVADIVGNYQHEEGLNQFSRHLFLNADPSQGIERINSHIRQWRDGHCENQGILKPWLEGCELQSDTVVVKDYSTQICVSISHFSRTNEDPIIPVARTCESLSLPKLNLDKLIDLWVLPCIWEFYVWLTDEMTNYDLMAGNVQSLSIGRVIENCKIRPYHSYWVSLWIKMKIGIRQYIHKFELLGIFNAVDESTTVWDLISTCDSVGTHNGALIDIMIGMLSDYKQIIYDLEGSGEKVLQSVEQLESIEKIVSFSPALIDHYLETDADNYSDSFSNKVINCSQDLSRYGIWQRLVWIAVTRQSELLVNIEINRIRDIIPELQYLRIKPRYCTFSGNHESLRSLSESSFEPIFHSLEKLEIQSLLRSLQFYESIPSNELDSMQDIINEVHGTNNVDLPRIFGIREPSLLAFLLTLQLREVPILMGFLNSLLQSEIYLFANKPLELKKSWPLVLDNNLNQLPYMDSEFNRKAKALEALLIDNEKILSGNCDSFLIAVLEKLFKSEEVLLTSFPLLADINTVFENSKSELLCGHYVYLRLKLRSWIASFKMKAADRAWDWVIQSHVPNNINSAELPSESKLKLRKIPWFMQEAVSSEAFQSEIDRNRHRKENQAAKRIQLHWRKRQFVLAQTNTSQPVSNVNVNVCMPVRSRPSHSKFQGRGSGVVSQVAREKEESKIMIGQLEIAFKDPKHTLNFVKKLKSIVDDKRVIPSDKEKPVFINALSFIDSYSNEVAQCIGSLIAGMDTVPMDFSVLKVVRDRLMDLEAIDSTEYIRVCHILDRVENILSEQRRILDKGTAPISSIKKLEKEAQIRGVTLDPLILSLKDHLKNDNDILLDGWRALRLDETTIELLVQACENFPIADDPFLLETATDSQREYLTKNGYIDKIDCRGDESTLKDVFDKLRPDINKQPLYSWVHSVALAAVASVMPTQIEYYRQDVWDHIKRYLDKIIRQPKLKVANIILLAFARMNPNCETSFRLACLRKVYSSKTEKWMTDAELQLLKLAITEGDVDHSSVTPQKQVVDALIQRWETLKSDDVAVPCPSIDKVMKMIGLKAVKEKILELYESFIAEQLLDPEARVAQSHNFILLGNPGTGKTTVAKILGEFLVEIGIRSTSTFIETTGEKLLRMGINKVHEEISKAKNGVLFIDEAYTLNPSRSADGKAIAELLLDVSESQRHEITIILAGYKDDIEEQLFNFNSGFASRFPHILTFDDYSEAELGSIFRHMCVGNHWKYANEDVIKAAARRVSRGKGRIPFSNARAVRTLLENAYRQALRRKNHAQTIILADVLRPKPSVESGSDLKAALDELNRTIGLASVKNEIYQLVNLASNNYDRELRGEKPLPVTLNRVFFGNPGTGKTTVANLYGRILKGLGLLSDGQCESKQPKDFIGAVVGESQNKTAALIQRCLGKVLIIDEAYGFYGSSFGADAVNALVGLVHNAPGEDIAVIMIGYEKQMRKMFREMNEGLARRISLNNPIVFEDYSDEELGRVAIKFAEANELTLTLSVREALTKSVSSQKYSSNFGNAGSVINMMTNAMTALSFRDPTSKVLSLEDLGLSLSREDPIAVIEKEFKMEHIVNELKILRAVIEQCERDGEDIKEHIKNYVFVGNPGTGKTTVARKMANFLHNLGLLGRNNVVIRSGLELQGSYLGQTKDKVIEAMTEAQGGVLFIDEAYSLGSQDSGGSRFAQEAVDQLVASMTEPEHFNRTVVILAGYPGKMDAMLQANQGLSSRFRGRMNFPDWDADDCVTFITQEIRKRNKRISDEATDLLKIGIAEVHSRPGWANARDCLTLISNLYQSRASRQSTSDSYEIDDVNYAINSFKISRPTQALQSHLPPPPVSRFADQESVIEVHVMPPNPAAAVEKEESSTYEPPDKMSFLLQPDAFIAHSAESLTDEDNDLVRKVAENEILEDYGERDPLFVALLEACRDAGYDSSHDMRKILIDILLAVESDEGDLPTHITDIVESKTGQPAHITMPILRPQVRIVLDGMLNAVRAEEEEMSEMRRLEEEGRQEERRQRKLERARQLETLRLSGLCPMGYSWHRQGDGWRCAGGSHFVSDNSLMSMDI